MPYRVVHRIFYIETEKRHKGEKTCPTQTRTPFQKMDFHVIGRRAND